LALVRPDLLPRGPYASLSKLSSYFKVGFLRTVVENSICTARTMPSLLSSWPPPEVKNAKFHRDATYEDQFTVCILSSMTHCVGPHSLDGVDEHGLPFRVDDFAVHDNRA